MGNDPLEIAHFHRNANVGRLLSLVFIVVSVGGGKYLNLL